MIGALFSLLVYLLGFAIGIKIFDFLSELKNKKYREKKIKENEANGMNTCPHCLYGMPRELSNYRIYETLNIDGQQKTIIKCWCCNSDLAADVNEGIVTIIND